MLYGILQHKKVLLFYNFIGSYALKIAGRKNENE